MKKNLLIQHFYILITCDFVYSLAMKISNNNNSEILHRISIADIESEDSWLGNKNTFLIAHKLIALGTTTWLMDWYGKFMRIFVLNLG